MDNSAAVNDGTDGFPIIHRFCQAELQTMKEVFPGIRFWKLLSLLKNLFPFVMYGEVFLLLHRQFGPKLSFELSSKKLSDEVD